MKTIVKNVTNSVIVMSVIAILLGIALIAYPGMSLVTLGIVVAAFLIVQGIALVIVDIKAWRMYIPFEGLLTGILSVILGAMLAKNPEKIADFIGIFLGLWIIVTGFSGIKTAFALRFTGAPWVLMVLINVVDVVIGILVLFMPVLSAVTLTQYLGFVLIAHAVFSFVYMLVLKKNAKDVEKLIMGKKDEIFVEPASADVAEEAVEEAAEDVVEEAAEGEDEPDAE